MLQLFIACVFVVMDSRSVSEETARTVFGWVRSRPTVRFTEVLLGDERRTEAALGFLENTRVGEVKERVLERTTNRSCLCDLCPFALSACFCSQANRQMADRASTNLQNGNQLVGSSKLTMIRRAVLSFLPDTKTTIPPAFPLSFYFAVPIHFSLGLRARPLVGDRTLGHIHQKPISCHDPSTRRSSKDIFGLYTAEATNQLFAFRHGL